MYAAGEVSNGASFRAASWKNGVETPLGPSDQVSEASSIAVSGSDVFVGGAIYDSTFKPQAVLWKNGVAQALTAPPMYGFVNAVAVSGSDVYAVGSTNDGVNTRATLWTNGVASTLPSKGLLSPNGSVLFYNSGASALVLQGTDVFIVGADYVNLKTAANVTASGAVPALWKNGAETLLGGATYAGAASAVCLAGTDLYIAGNSVQGSGNSATTAAVYWENGNLVNLADTAANADAIVVSGNDVYVGGQLGYGTGQTKATLWKNGTLQDLSGGKTRSELNSLQLLNGDVYAAGLLVDTGASYWRNGSPVVVGPVGSDWLAITFLVH